MKFLLFYLFVFVTILSCSDTKEKTGYIRAGALNVYYAERGQGPAVVLVHAGFQTSTMWKDQVQALKEDFRVITIDLPAHGKTTGKDSSFLIQDVLLRVLDSLGVEKASLVGLSLGTVCLQDFALAYPDRVEKLVLIAPGIHGFEQYQPVDSLTLSWYPEMQEALDKRDTVKAARIFTQAWAEGPYRSADSLKAPVSRYVFEATLDNMRMHKISGWPVLRKDPPAFARLSSIKAPVLIIHGNQDLPYINEASRYLEKTIPNARRVLLTDVAHMLNMEKPEEVNRLILQFLQSDLTDR